MAPSQHQEPRQRREMESLSETPEGTNPVGALMANSWLLHSGEDSCLGWFCKPPSYYESIRAVMGSQELITVEWKTEQFPLRCYGTLVMFRTIWSCSRPQDNVSQPFENYVTFMRNRRISVAAFQLSVHQRENKGKTGEVGLRKRLVLKFTLHLNARRHGAREGTLVIRGLSFLSWNS